jgi:hypothetical protein
VAGKLLAHQYPAHPNLDPDATGTAVKPIDARKVFTHVRAAAEARDGRVEVPAGDRKLMQRIAGPLRLGQQKEAYFELSRYWADHFRQLASAQGVAGDLTLIRLTDWADQPEPRGLPDFLARLVVASFAEMDDRVWVRGGTVLDPAPELSAIKDHDALRSQPLPSEDDWTTARQRFETIFGQKAPTLRRGRMVNQFARQITESARAHREDAAELVRQLEEHATFLGLDETDDSGRLALARRSLQLLEKLTSGAAQGGAGAKKTVEALAGFDLGTVSADRYGTSIKQAGSVARAVTEASWHTLELGIGLGAEGAALLESLRNVARGDQRIADLREALKRTEREILALIKRNQAAATPPPAPATPTTATGPAAAADDLSLNTPTSDPRIPFTQQPGTPQSTGTNATPGRSSGHRTTTAAQAAKALESELAELAKNNPGATIEISWRVVD